MAFTVYVLRNRAGSLYIRQTSELGRRLAEHESGLGGWTGGGGRGPWELVYSEEYETRAEAMARERALKRGRPNQELRARLQGGGEGGC
jgi:predicted GIY-YIG superfamily endonuclease